MSYKMGRRTDSWTPENWLYVTTPEGVKQRHAFISLKDSMIQYSVGKVDYFFRLTFVYRIPFTGFDTEGKTQNSGAYIGQMLKYYCPGRVDQFWIFHCCHGQEPRLIPMNVMEMQQRAREIEELEAIAKRISWSN